MKTVRPYTPIQYIMERTKFFGLDILVNEDVFIPRPETELLVQTALDFTYDLRLTTYDVRILDLCTGSGNIVISLARSLNSALTKNIHDYKIVASDISDKALEVAKRNAQFNGVFDRIEFIKSDLFERLEGEFDIIVSNPPYVARYEFPTLQKEVLMEPRIAIDGGEDGMDFYRKIIQQAPRYLSKGGFLIFEIGFGQKNYVKDIFDDTKSFEAVKTEKDQNDIERVMAARWKG